MGKKRSRHEAIAKRLGLGEDSQKPQDLDDYAYSYKDIPEGARRLTAICRCGEKIPGLNRWELTPSKKCVECGAILRESAKFRPMIISEFSRGPSLLRSTREIAI